MIHLDSSILVSALLEDEAQHAACTKRLLSGKPAIWSHALAETFSTLTGGRLSLRLAPEEAAELIARSLLPRLRLVDFSAADLRSLFQQAAHSGARGGAIYDFLHLRAAAKAGAEVLYTLNARHFKALAREGDPRIELP